MVNTDDADNGRSKAILAVMISVTCIVCIMWLTIKLLLLIMMTTMHRSEAVLTMMSNAKSVSVTDIEGTGIDLSQR